jgi:hypothetical protein
LHQLCGIRQIQFTFDVNTVGFDGLDTKKKPCGDFPRWKSVSNQIDDFKFPIAQAADWRISRTVFRTVDKAIQHLCRHALTHEQLAVTCAANRIKHTARYILLHHVSARTGL